MTLKNKIVCIAGPTAAGKSDLALKLAQKLNGEIINADSRQFYREMIIGTAKPDADTLMQIPHHLIDCTSITQPWSVADFINAAEIAIADIRARGKRPIMVGGTGLYLRSLIDGLAPVPAIDPAMREKLRARLEDEGLPNLYNELIALDPSASGRIKPEDTQRILRALEVVTDTGRALSEHWKGSKTKRHEAVLIGLELPRAELCERIDARVVKMIQAGLAQEAQRLWQDFPKNPLLSKTIGYAEWPKLGWENDAAVTQTIQANTRQFAKRQMTWFRGQMPMTWINASDETALAQALHVVQ